MTPTQVNLLKKLLDSKEFAIYVKLNKVSVLATGISISNEKKRLAMLQTAHYNCNPFFLDTSHIEIYRIPKPLDFFSAQGECNTLQLQGITWVCVKPKEVIPGDILLDAKDLKTLYLAISPVVEEVLEAYVPNSDSDSQRKLKYIEDVVAIRPIF